ncbi:MAG: phospho-sugar mutase [Mycoplasmataceae bacterium]|nr:phospho-sugar mutase [Mycoplasmataceae bacterium]
MEWKKNYKYWLENSPKKIKNIIESYNEKEKKLYFSNNLTFGTAGLREVIGYGSSLINEFNIAKYSLAFAKFLLSKYGNSAKEYGVVIAHDNRRGNILYSETAAQVISALGIPVFLFDKNNLQPTPLLSYAIVKGNYVGGLNITASHNPPEYNGFKIYNHTGTQMLPKDTNSILKFSNEDINIFKIKKNNKNIYFLSKSIESQYLRTVLQLIPFKSLEKPKNIKVIFTSQHGTAVPFAKEILTKMKVEYYFVKEQMKPDPEFSNTESPNPQDPRSFILARKYGDKYDADVLFCTDPDADRFGIEVKHKGKWIHINGNQLPLIQLDYKLSELKKLNYLNPGDFIVRSVVTSTAGDRIAANYNVQVYENLTGFKWLIFESFKHEMQGNECIFAWEESYGSTIRSFTRDKDSFQALVQVIEIVDMYKKENKTLVDVLQRIYEEIGFFETSQIQSKFIGVNAMQKMNEIINKVRTYNVGDKIKEFEIIEIRDFAKGYKNLYKDNFIMLIFDDDVKVTLRPSGTESTLRKYFDVPGTNKELTRIKIRR